MASAIYAIKMWLFRDQFPIQQRQSSERASRQSYSQKVWNHLLRVHLYITRWSPKERSSIPEGNPYVPRQGSLTSSPNSFSRHLWYLSETLVGLSLFDDSHSSKNSAWSTFYNMRNNHGSDEPPNRLPPIHYPPTKALNDFFTTSTTKIIQILGLDDSFLDRDPRQWESEQSYSEAKISYPP